MGNGYYNNQCRLTFPKLLTDKKKQFSYFARL
jgi:hypothetical protein